MHRYNLLNEPWLKVLDTHNQVQKVGIFDILENAQNYQCLAGDMPMQSYTQLRLLLAILETIISRYDTNSEPQSKTKMGLKETWKQLWKNQVFPKEWIHKYLDKYQNRFNLFDDQYPFMQINHQRLDQELPKIKKTGTVASKLFNRLISESNNKANMFNPTTNKNKLTDAEFARWLLMFQNVSSLADKGKYKKMKASGSGGWLMELGNIYLQGENLFQTLMLNLDLEEYQNQHPIWELDFKDILHIESGYMPDNRAQLYTTPARLIYVNPNTDLAHEDITLTTVQLSGLDIEKARDMEPMTMFHTSKSENHKNMIVPKQHLASQSLWEQFGLLEGINDSSIYRPGIINDFYQNKQSIVDNQIIKINAVGMPYKLATVKLPTDEIFDSLSFHTNIFKDTNLDGHIVQINNEVDLTQDAIHRLNKFVYAVMAMRNHKDNNQINNYMQSVYFDIEIPFKNWIFQIDDQTEMRKHIQNWHHTLFNILNKSAKSLMYPLSTHDLQGEVYDNHVENIITKYTYFTSGLRNDLKLKQ